MLENFGFRIVHKTLGFIQCSSAVYVNAHFFVHIIHIINMYYEHYFYFAVNLLINTPVRSCSYLRVCSLFFFCSFTWNAGKDVSLLCERVKRLHPSNTCNKSMFLGQPTGL